METLASPGRRAVPRRKKKLVVSFSSVYSIIAAESLQRSSRTPHTAAHAQLTIVGVLQDVYIIVQLGYMG